MHIDRYRERGKNEGEREHSLGSVLSRLTMASVRQPALGLHLWILVSLLFFIHAHSFYLPGVAPQDFRKANLLKVKVNKLTSTKTQLPYSYYSLPFCKPKKIVDSAENLGEVLRGDRIENSPYEFKMREPQMCNIVCHVVLDTKTAKEFKEKIDDDYWVNMILDNLPLVVPVQRSNQESPIVYGHGFRVGLKGRYTGSKDEKYFINNHLAFTVKFHKDPETETARIVGFEVKPFSIKHAYEGEWKDQKTRLTTCDPHAKKAVTDSESPQEVEDKKEIIFTYDVDYQESDVKWASRWDTYLLMGDDQIHWFSIVNSLMIVLFLSGMVAMIMLRTLYRDISKYNQLETQEEAQEETGWKLVHGDVFRPPINSDLLCVYVGTGVQFFGMILVTMIFAAFGFLSPSNRGGLMTAMLVLWVFMSLFAGYSSARLYKMFKGTEWKKITIRTALIFPGTVFALFFVLNALIWGEKSSGAVPFGTMFALVVLWFGISVPLVFVGAYVGFKKPALEAPVRTNKIPRQIPEQAWYMNPVFSILIGGILPFGAVFIELFFILTSVWLHQFYYIFGFLFIVFLILIVTCAEITIVLCYFQLCSEDYHWWWRSYLTSGSSALYLFLYAAFYFSTKLEITKPVSGLLYFGYMLIVSYAFFVLTGTIGFYACFWFTRLIYSSVKID
ncbi:transmembrane 9 superfamily member 9-like [Diospyros lotus]|uniref:transmembrane 9 superfamily member 9-like n=1 Tax=Diospyros lotus TaxID=55363 RepID=UPI00224CB38E|nr:transmembrane 9 superfamily member 9-like [Diospyros lotus]